MKRNQRGAALLIALLVVLFIISIMAMTAPNFIALSHARAQTAAVQRVHQLLNVAQAYQTCQNMYVGQTDVITAQCGLLQNELPMTQTLDHGGYGYLSVFTAGTTWTPPGPVVAWPGGLQVGSYSQPLVFTTNPFPNNSMGAILGSASNYFIGLPNYSSGPMYLPCGNTSSSPCYIVFQQGGTDQGALPTTTITAGVFNITFYQVGQGNNPPSWSVTATSVNPALNNGVLVSGTVSGTTQMTTSVTCKRGSTQWAC